MKKCPCCDKEIPSESNFCSFCGAKLITEIQGNNDSIQSVTNNRLPELEKELAGREADFNNLQRNVQKWSKGASRAGYLALAGFLLFAIFGRSISKAFEVGLGSAVIFAIVYFYRQRQAQKASENSVEANADIESLRNKIAELKGETSDWDNEAIQEGVRLEDHGVEN
jgi:uncharacterized protein YlxW (UPF0749 family)